MMIALVVGIVLVVAIAGAMGGVMGTRSKKVRLGSMAAKGGADVEAA